jgi:hypothetical protein
VVIPIVEIGTSLAGDGEGVFKTGSGDESDARAFALEQGIGGNGGAVADLDGCVGRKGGDLGDGFKDGTAGVIGSGGEFEDADAAADAVDAISEGATGVDGDDEVLRHPHKTYQAEGASK